MDEASFSIPKSVAKSNEENSGTIPGNFVSLGETSESSESPQTVSEGMDLYSLSKTLLSEGSINKSREYSLIDEEPAPINRLPNELLDFIFTFLTIKERIRAECVCRRWRIVGIEQPWSEPKYLSFVYTGEEQSSRIGKCEVNDDILCAILSRCGTRLKGLKVSNRFHMSITCKAMEIISNYCPNLTEIQLTLEKLSLSGNSLEKLGEKCQKLKVVFLSYDGELSLEPFLKNCKKIESLRLFGGKLGPKGGDFDVINGNLKVLHMHTFCGSLNLQSETLRKLMGNCGYLQEFRVSCTDKYTVINPDLWLKVVCYYRKTLKVLELTGYERLSINWCTALKELQKLEELYMSIPENLSFPCHQSKNCFNVISEHIKTFHAKHIQNLEYELLVKKLVERNNCLQELHLLLYTSLSPDILKLCFKYTDSMKDLFLVGDLKSFKANNWCELFSSLRSLEKVFLHVCGPEFNDEVAQCLAKCCLKLQVLNVGPTAISDGGLKAISSLPSLTELEITKV